MTNTIQELQLIKHTAWMNVKLNWENLTKSIWRSRYEYIGMQCTSWMGVS